MFTPLEASIRKNAGFCRFSREEGLYYRPHCAAGCQRSNMLEEESIRANEPPRISVNSFKRSGSAITSACGTQMKHNETANLARVQRGSDAFYFSSYHRQAGDRVAIYRVPTRKRI